MTKHATNILPKYFRTADRRYLNVPYDEKEDAKWLGAQWDSAAKLWYAPNGIDHAPFKKWFGREQSFEQKRDAALKKYHENKKFWHDLALEEAAKAKK